MPSLAVSFAEVMAGAILLHKGVQNAQGSLAGGGSTSTASGSTAGAPSGSQHGLVSVGQLARIGRSHGWSGSQITDWFNVIKAESNGTLTDTNPGSGAYGIAQFINGPSEYAQYGGNSTTLTGQLVAMANYIQQRYGTPAAAWAHEQSQHWY